jgi:hypothetical protein
MLVLPQGIICCVQRVAKVRMLYIEQVITKVIESMIMWCRVKKVRGLVVGGMIDRSDNFPSISTI